MTDRTGRGVNVTNLSRSLLQRLRESRPWIPVTILSVAISIGLVSTPYAMADSVSPCGGTGVIVSYYSYTVVNPEGHVGCVALTGATVSVDGNLHAAISLSDPPTTNFVYDSNSRLTSDTGVDATTTVYDSSSRLVSETDPSGTTSYGYDGLNRPSQVTEPGGIVTQYQYDAMSRVVTEIQPGATTTYTYDGMDRIAGSSDTMGRTTSYSYDSSGDLSSSVDPIGRTTTYSYDAQNRLISTTDIGGTTRYTYDAGLLQSSTDPLGRVTRYTYDSGGRMTSESDNGGTTAFEYTNSVPEPGSLLMLGIGMLGVLAALKPRILKASL